MSAPSPIDKTITQELDADVLQRGWAAVSPRPPRFDAAVAWAGRTDIGRVREHNEDKFDFFLPEDPTVLALRGRLWAVADGMGGHSAGQIASEVALKTLIRAYFNPLAPEDTEAALRDALTEANSLIYQAARRFEDKAGMGTTVVAAVVRDDGLTIAHVGDSRAYLLRGDEPLRPLTADHSWVEEMVRRGAMSRAEAEASPQRHYILRSVGVMATVEPDITTISVQTGDVVLLCSDGLCGYVDDATMETVLRRPLGLAQNALDLIDAANDAGGRDNSTALLLRVGAVTPTADKGAAS